VSEGSAACAGDIPTTKEPITKHTVTNAIRAARSTLVMTDLDSLHRWQTGARQRHFHEAVVEASRDLEKAGGGSMAGA